MANTATTKPHNYYKIWFFVTLPLPAILFYFFLASSDIINRVITYRFPIWLVLLAFLNTIVSLLLWVVHGFDKQRKLPAALRYFYEFLIVAGLVFVILVATYLLVFTIMYAVSCNGITGSC